MPASPDPVAWLDAWMAAFPWSASGETAGAALLRDVLALPKAARVPLHKEAVRRLPLLRVSEDPLRWTQGSAGGVLRRWDPRWTR